MKKESIKKWRIWSALHSVDKNIDLKNLAIKEDFLELSNFIQELIDIDYIDYNHGSYYLTDKGRYEMKEIQEDLKLNGLDKFVVPNFDVLIDSLTLNDLYYF